ncbi:hypothetical protein ACTXT7_001448 [Hymenolepis weldensis]
MCEKDHDVDPRKSWAWFHFHFLHGAKKASPLMTTIKASTLKIQKDPVINLNRISVVLHKAQETNALKEENENFDVLVIHYQLLLSSD